MSEIWKAIRQFEARRREKLSSEESSKANLALLAAIADGYQTIEKDVEPSTSSTEQSEPPLITM